MECIIEFCSDEYQRRLRLLSQAQSERYETTLENYKKIFLAHYKNIIVKCADGKCSNRTPCQHITKVLKKTKIDKIEAFFDGLIEVYMEWINANSITSINHMEKLLKSYKLLDDNSAEDMMELYFKGRVTSEVLTSWDMFHIPFNKRYLINNQRYSLTGQPLMYIGSSILDVMEELDIDKVEELKISAIQIPKGINLYDLRNNIYEELNKVQTEMMLSTTGYTFKETFLYRVILASVCSFQKRQELKNYSFCEEYVLPQILAQIVKNNRYEGIIYYSTKRFDNLKLETKDLSYKENIALFTMTNADHVYDRDLYNRLKISVPIDKSKIEKITSKDIEEVKKEIGKMKNQGKISQAETMISSFKRIYGELEIDGTKYCDTDAGQLHMYHLFATLNQILM